MWNKVLVFICVAGVISILDIFPQDSVVSELENDTGKTMDTIYETIPEIVADSITETATATDVGSKQNLHVLPSNLTKFQRDSIINAVPKDTSSFAEPRFFNGELSEKYAADNDLDYERNINKSFFQRLKEMISELLKKLFGMPEISKINNLSDIILRILLVAIFLAAVYIVIRLFMNHRGRWFFEKSDETVPIDLTNVEKHIHEADFETLFKEAEQNGDTRQSVRLLYLWLLRKFTDRQVIQWNPEKTNIDYLVEIRDKALQEQFRYLSYLFNYIWYGEFSMNDEDYKTVRETFLRHIKAKPENE